MSVKRNKRVPIYQFGRDHWSVLGYIFTLCIDGHWGVGTITHSRMRTNEKMHPLLKQGKPTAEASWRKESGTRLAGYTQGDGSRQLSKHDDWDCLEDLEACGLVDIISIANGFVRVTDPLGIIVACELMSHKARGGTFGNFTMSQERLDMLSNGKLQEKE